MWNRVTILLLLIGKTVATQQRTLAQHDHRHLDASLVEVLGSEDKPYLWGGGVARTGPIGPLNLQLLNWTVAFILHVFASVFLSSRGSPALQGDQPHGGQRSLELPDVARQGGECGVPHQPVQLQQYHRPRGRQEATAGVGYARAPWGLLINSNLNFRKELWRLGRWFRG